LLRITTAFGRVGAFAVATGGDSHVV
jgi:hypothetical protein